MVIHMSGMTRIYIADASPEYCRILSVILCQDENSEIIGTAQNGEEALEAIERLKPDILLIDPVLPKLSGIEILKKLKSADCGTRVIVVSSLVSSAFAEECIALGADCFFPKPCDIVELVSKVIELSAENTVPGILPFMRPYLPSDPGLEREVTEIIRQLGIPAHVKGYQYLREAILLTVNDIDTINSVTKTLYPQIARRFSTTSSRVERAIRHAIELGWDRSTEEVLMRFFGCSVSGSKGKPTNSEFIAMIADHLLLRKKYCILG